MLSLKRVKNNKGQFLIEAMLLIIVFVSIGLSFIRFVKDNKIVTGMITEPWERVAGMTEFGMWSKPTREGRKKHPNTYERFYTPREL